MNSVIDDASGVLYRSADSSFATGDATPGFVESTGDEFEDFSAVTWDKSSFSRCP
jgi:hypothetical protein